MIMPFTFNTTARIVFAEGAAEKLDEHAAFLGNRVLLVTDKGMIGTGLVAPIADALRKAGRTVEIFDDVLADPPRAIVMAAAAQARHMDATGVLGLGGGSSLDVAKLAALLAPGTESLDAAFGVGNAKGPRLPLALVPTTAGTGSEVTPISIVTVEDDEKRGVVSPVILPDLAVLDPRLTVGLPAHVTAATGVDAMVHAIEAYTSKSANNNPLSRNLATEALRLLGGHIERAVSDGGDMEARSAMLLGSMLAGQAFANSPVAAVHALAYPIGGRFHVPHGLSNALVLPHVLRFNAPEAASAYAELAPHAFPALGTGGGTQDVAARFIEELAALTARLGLETRLRQVGISENDLAMMAHDAMKQTRLLVNNPREVSEEDAFAIYRAAY
ncbi:iron-containing alcohol dehydrogenase [Stappia sp. F7233]|uniref:Alcohol dehydrogenase 2 n=1 Tax=Stappia albiluteola TaxID=2758565 RepID=A0A839AA82_9HYPH|nr:iron-containing alcohol dehydrogenase [Stappia albiluteola]MBA5775827.1 iron-containing alcohol dehydrogenase [Stappia albiluteola]